MRAGPTLPSVWPCTRWGLPSQVSHLTCWCALTAPFHPYREGRWPSLGGIFSVALSLVLRPVGVTHHLVLRCPDFPPILPLAEPAIVQSSLGTFLVYLFLALPGIPPFELCFDGPFDCWLVQAPTGAHKIIRGCVATDSFDHHGRW